jgi:hypothetical protein
MTDEFIADQDVVRALDWLRDEAKTLGKLTEEARFYEHMVKHTLAREMKCHEGAVAVQEREAKASTAYISACTKDAIAAGHLAEARALREAAILKIETWRSQQANIRARGGSAT